MSLIDARIYANIINSASLLPEQLKAIIAFIKKRDQVLIDYYKNHKGFLEIDGNMKITQINEQIRGFLDA